MPLHAYAPQFPSVESLTFDRLSDAIWTACNDANCSSRLIHGLTMHTSNATKPPSPQYLMKLTRPLDNDGMFPTTQRFTMQANRLQGSQCSTKCYVQQLTAATDSQDRTAVKRCFIDQFDFEQISLAVGAAVCRIRFVTCGVTSTPPPSKRPSNRLASDSFEQPNFTLA